MALGTYISGAYTGTYNATAIGQTNDGYTLSVGAKAEMIDSSDAYANTTLDFVWRGGQARMRFTAKEFTAGNQAILWPYGSFGVLSSTSGPVGRLASDIAAAFVLTATANTPAATSPATQTASKAILSPDYETQTLFDSRLRQLPIELMLLPYTSSSNVIFASRT